MARLKPYGCKSADLVMGSTQGYIRTQVEPRKKVRFAEDLTFDQDRPTKKVKSAQASIHQTAEGRVGKSYGGATASSKDKRVRQSQISRAITAGESEDESERAYEWTTHGNPLRKLMRDECVYETHSAVYMGLHVESGHPEFAIDVMVEFLRIRDINLTKKVEDVYQLHDRHGRNTDKCHYHQHNEAYPRCVPEPVEECESLTE